MTEDVFWLMLVLGAIAMSHRSCEKTERSKRREVQAQPIPDSVAAQQEYFDCLCSSLTELFSKADLVSPRPSLVYMISRNRPAMTCLQRSVRAVKADSAVNLFNIDSSEITWAVVDCGIDAQHPAFKRRSQVGGCISANPNATFASTTRVAATYDFTVIRPMLSSSDDDLATFPTKLKRVLKSDPANRKDIRERLLAGREIDWSLLMPFNTVPHDKTYTPPVHDHGTHEAGIIGADWRREEDDEGRLDSSLIGVCPTINLVDLRILDDAGRSDEFGVMASMQFLRYLNSQKEFMDVHGVNLSLSIRHYVANYACGRTPICEECNRLVASGMMVVEAAGNEGFIKESKFATGGEYQAVSITDSGNA